MYIPRVLLCGVLSGRVKAEVVGRLSFKGAAERGEFVMPANATAANNFKLAEGSFRIFLDGKEISIKSLRGLLENSADYILFASRDEFLMRFRELYALKLVDRVIELETLGTCAADGFFSLNNAVQIFNLIHALKLPHTLDADAYFAKNDYHMFPDLKPKLAGVVPEVEFPLLENFYAEIYRTLAECRFKFFDAVLLTDERTPVEFLDALIETDALSDNVLTFVRRGSTLENWLAENGRVFKKISRFGAVNGDWALIEKQSRADFACYVVTHKDAQLNELPEGYRIIHAGRALGSDLGYLGDDSGENISRLNPYLNEITALYWIWKHTRHDLIGFVHYRRFFTLDRKNFLTADEARKIMRGFDIIVERCKFGYVPLRDWKAVLSGRNLAEHVIATIGKHIARRQPDYLAAFNRVNNGFGAFCYEIFVTRREIFTAYCEWLFSFIIDATEEILATTDLKNSDDPRIYRAVSFAAEHLLTVWLIKNRLRVKTLPIIFRNNV